MRHRTGPASAAIPPWLSNVQQELSAELLQTHISWLLLTADAVYKVKKPMATDFLDYSTLALRRHYCREEVRLNSRFAPQLYHGVTALGDGAEPAVVMRRFAESNRLDHVCARGELTRGHIGALVRQAVALHAQADAATPGSTLGSPALLAAQRDQSLADLAGTGVIDPAEVTRLEALLGARFAEIETAVADRHGAGRVREGHGDLHLANIVLLDGVVTMFDGIEFSEELRWLDIANELAFAYADLLTHGRPSLASVLASDWIVETGDVEGLTLLRYFASYRATVRAMTAGMAGDSAAALDYLDQAIRLATPPPQPQLIITHGVAGSGKSTAAQQWTVADPRAATVWLRSDVERKRLFGLEWDAVSGSELDSGLYTPAASERTYHRLAQMAEVALRAGWSVVVDAAFLRRRDRELFRDTAAACSAGFGILACAASTAELRRRIAARTGDASEADLAVLEQQLAAFVPLTVAEAGLCVELH